MSGTVNMFYKSFFLCLWIWFSHGVFGGTDVMKSLSVMEGDSVTLNTDVNVQRDDQILWMFKVNNSFTRIAEIHRQKIYIGDSTVAFRKRVQMDRQTGSMTIRNIRTEHSGLYKLQIIKDEVTSKSFSVAVYDVFEPCDIIIKTVQTCEEEVLYAETTFCARSVHSTKPDEEQHVIYSSINVK
ncbi:hypothetical protein cypCar_00036816 [Cyprinus carpio]|nr:hypothetical protein cypCar_00036816 [Cyprinus carpio]